MHMSQLASSRSRKNARDSRIRTECVKSLDDVARLSKGVLVEPMVSEAVHLLLVSRAKLSADEHQLQTQKLFQWVYTKA